MEALLGWAIVATSGALTWWMGRSVRAGSPALAAERWSAFMNRASATVTLGIVFAEMMTPIRGLILCWFPAFFAATFSARRHRFNETWSFWRYMLTMHRAVFARGAYWLTLAFLPTVMVTSQRTSWLDGGMLATLAMLLLAVHGRWFLRITGTRPITDAVLLTAFETVLEKARCPRPKIVVTDDFGNCSANAMALPAKQPAVIFGHTLLAQLSTSEVKAILGHEVAHLEHHGAAWRRSFNAVLWGLMILAGSLMPLCTAVGADAAARQIASAWPGVVLVGWLLWMVSRQSHEGDCDVRGAELGGDIDAMISGLVKVHELLGVPRRREASAEELSSHPALTKRIRRLRALQRATSSDAEPFATLLVEIRGRGTSVALFEADKLCILRDLPAGLARDPDTLRRAARQTSSLDVKAMQSIALLASSTGPRLLAKSAETDIDVLLHEGDAERVQSALDHWERVFPERAVNAAATLLRAAGLALSLLSSLAAPALGLPPPLAVVGCALLFAPSVRTFAMYIGLGTGLLVYSLLTGAGYEEDPSPFTLWLMAAFLVLAAGVLIAALRAGARPPLRSLGLTVLSLIVCVLFARLLLLGAGPVALHAELSTSPCTMGLTLALTLALALERTRTRRLLAILPASAAAACLASLHPASAALAGDPFAARSAALLTQPWAPTLLHKFRLPPNAFAFRASPDGSWVAGKTWDEPSEEDRPYVLTNGGALLDTGASALAAIDTSRLVAIDQADSGTLGLRDAAAPATNLSTIELLPARGAKTSLRIRDGRYVVTSADRRYGVIRQQSGAIHQAPDRQSVVRLRRGHWVRPEDGAGTFIFSTMQFNIERMPWMRPKLWACMQSGVGTTTQISKAAASGTKPLFRTQGFVDCRPWSAADELHLCIVRGPQTRFFELDPRTARVTPLGEIGTWLNDFAVAHNRFLGATEDAILLLRRGDRTAKRLSTPNGTFTGAVSLEERLALVGLDQKEGTEVLVFDLSSL